MLILNLELPILYFCSKIATKVRYLRPKMSSKVPDSGQNVCTHHVQLFPALPILKTRAAVPCLLCFIFTGLECIITNVQQFQHPYCSDYDECKDPRHSKSALNYCGENAICSNTVGSFICICLPGYANFSPNVGCVDIDECTNPAYNYSLIDYCGTNTECHNTPGWSDAPDTYNCSCSQGYELFDVTVGKIVCLQRHFNNL